jgi:mannose-6-phosphate isomerase-like protein (cupin superfamily)
MKPINLAEKFALFSEHWAPKVIAQMNDYQFKLVKFKGEFVWHNHPDTDEAFIVIHGTMAIHFRDGEVSVAQAKCSLFPRARSTRPLRRPSARPCSSRSPAL